MSTPLLSAAQLAAIRTVAERGMQTTCVIGRRTTANNVYEDGGTVSWPTVATVQGWLRSMPTPNQVTDEGSLVTANTYRLLLPVGTDCRVGDQVTIGADVYTVSDTSGESTWQAVLNVSLRKRE
jgi:hypothetical protein